MDSDKREPDDNAGRLGRYCPLKPRDPLSTPLCDRELCQWWIWVEGGLGNCAASVAALKLGALVVATRGR